MLYIEITDGLGNQLYRYATAYALAQLAGKRLTVDSSYMALSGERVFELNKLQLKWDDHICWRKPGVFNKYFLNHIRKHFALKGVTYFVEDSKKGSCQEHEGLIELAKSVEKLYLKGYFQNYRMFDLFQRELSSMIKPNYTLDKTAYCILEDMQKTESVSIHLRRGDYVKLGFVLDDAYYESAIQEITKRLSNPKFFIFSDDKTAAKKFIEKYSNLNMCLVDYTAINSTIEDLYLMKSCKHQIIANSSYSWWSGYANHNTNKIVVAPDGKNDLNRNKLYPTSWTVLDY